MQNIEKVITIQVDLWSFELNWIKVIVVILLQNM